MSKHQRNDNQVDVPRFGQFDYSLFNRTLTSRSTEQDSGPRQETRDRSADAEQVVVVPTLGFQCCIMRYCICVQSVNMSCRRVPRWQYLALLVFGAREKHLIVLRRSCDWFFVVRLSRYESIVLFVFRECTRVELERITEYV